MFIFFNRKYNRIGHLFQDRFRSEPIEDDRGLLAVTRYIHNNTVEANLVGSLDNYQWSSYHDYTKQDKGICKVNIETILEMFSDDEAQAIKLFKEFTNEKSSEIFIELGNMIEKSLASTNIKNTKSPDEELIKTLGYSLDEIKNLKDKTKRNKAIREIKGKTSMTIRELSRLLNLSKDIIFRALGSATD